MRGPAKRYRRKACCAAGRSGGIETLIDTGESPRYSAAYGPLSHLDERKTQMEYLIWLNGDYDEYFALPRTSQGTGMTEDEARQTVLAGSTDDIRRQLQAYIDIGVTHFIINLRRPGLYDREAVRVFAKEVMPGFRAEPVGV